MERKNAGKEPGGSLPGEDVFDEKGALEVVAGDKELLKEIIDVYLEEHLGDLEKIEEALRRADGQALERAAHSLKGSVGSVGGRRAWEAAYLLERMGKEGRLSEAQEALGRLRKELENLNQSLTKYLGR